MAKGRKRDAPSTTTPVADTTTKSDGTTANSDAKIRKQAYTGDAPVDSYVPNADQYEVVSLFNKVYSCTLNQSNVNHNNNKFYIL